MILVIPALEADVGTWAEGCAEFDRSLLGIVDHAALVIELDLSFPLYMTKEKMSEITRAAGNRGRNGG